MFECSNCVGKEGKNEYRSSEGTTRLDGLQFKTGVTRASLTAGPEEGWGFCHVFIWRQNITDRGRGYCVSVCWAIITKYSWPEELVNYGNLCSLFWRLEVWDQGTSMVPHRRLRVISKGGRAGHPSGVSFIRELILLMRTHDLVTS